MTIEEKIREIMLSKKLSDSEKLDQLHALIPADSCKIDNLRPGDTRAVQTIERRLSDYRSDARDQACRVAGKETERNQVAAARLPVSQYAK